MDVRKKEIEELQSQAQALSQEGKSTDEVDGKRLIVEQKFLELLEPLTERKANLLASKEIHQFNRDVEDEIVSISLGPLVNNQNGRAFETGLSSSITNMLDQGCLITSPQGSPQAQKFCGERVVAALIATSQLSNLQICGEPCEWIVWVLHARSNTQG